MASDKHETASGGQHPHGSDKGQQHADEQERQRREQAARTPQQDHTPRQEEQYARDRPPAALQGQAAPDPKAAAELKEARAASSIGAQVILDFNEDASLGARGGAGADITENTMARDMQLVAMGLDPVSPVGPPPTPEALKARREAEAKAAEERLAVPPFGKATRVSSLAAGINSGDVPVPPNDPPAEAANQPAAGA
jgi:hypothetical protein